MSGRGTCRRTRLPETVVRRLSRRLYGRQASMESNRSYRRTTLRSGALTGISTAAVSASAAVAGVILSRKFGHGVKTDGFFAAYGVYLALVLVASAIRVVALPGFARARAGERLGGEVASWLAGLAVPFVPLLALSIAWPDLIAHALTHDAEAQR